jgi:hypothetical protein
LNEKRLDYAREKAKGLLDGARRVSAAQKRRRQANEEAEAATTELISRKSLTSAWTMQVEAQETQATFFFEEREALRIATIALKILEADLKGRVEKAKRAQLAVFLGVKRNLETDRLELEMRTKLAEKEAVWAQEEGRLKVERKAIIAAKGKSTGKAFKAAEAALKQAVMKKEMERSIFRQQNEDELAARLQRASKLLEAELHAVCLLHAEDGAQNRRTLQHPDEGALSALGKMELQAMTKTDQKEAICAAAAALVANEKEMREGIRRTKHAHGAVFERAQKQLEIESVELKTSKELMEKEKQLNEDKSKLAAARKSGAAAHIASAATKALEEAVKAQEVEREALLKQKEDDWLELDASGELAEKDRQLEQDKSKLMAARKSAAHAQLASAAASALEDAVKAQEAEREALLKQKEDELTARLERDQRVQRLAMEARNEEAKERAEWEREFERLKATAVEHELKVRQWEAERIELEARIEHGSKQSSMQIASLQAEDRARRIVLAAKDQEHASTLAAQQTVHTKALFALRQEVEDAKQERANAMAAALNSKEEDVIKMKEAMCRTVAEKTVGEALHTASTSLAREMQEEALALMLANVRQMKEAMCRTVAEKTATEAMCTATASLALRKKDEAHAAIFTHLHKMKEVVYRTVAEATVAEAVYRASGSVTMKAKDKMRAAEGPNRSKTREEELVQDFPQKEDAEPKSSSVTMAEGLLRQSLASQFVWLTIAAGMTNLKRKQAEAIRCEAIGNPVVNAAQQTPTDQQEHDGCNTGASPVPDNQPSYQGAEASTSYVIPAQPIETEADDESATSSSKSHYLPPAKTQLIARNSLTSAWTRKVEVREQRLEGARERAKELLDGASRVSAAEKERKRQAAVAEKPTIELASAWMCAQNTKFGVENERIRGDANAGEQQGALWLAMNELEREKGELETRESSALKEKEELAAALQARETLYAAEMEAQLTRLQREMADSLERARSKQAAVAEGVRQRHEHELKAVHQEQAETLKLKAGDHHAVVEAATKAAKSEHEAALCALGEQKAAQFAEEEARLVGVHNEKLQAEKRAMRAEVEAEAAAKLLALQAGHDMHVSTSDEAHAAALLAMQEAHASGREEAQKRSDAAAEEAKQLCEATEEIIADLEREKGELETRESSALKEKEELAAALQAREDIELDEVIHKEVIKDLEWQNNELKLREGNALKAMKRKEDKYLAALKVKDEDDGDDFLAAVTAGLASAAAAEKRELESKLQDNEVLLQHRTDESTTWQKRAEQLADRVKNNEFALTAADARVKDTLATYESRISELEDLLSLAETKAEEECGLKKRGQATLELLYLEDSQSASKFAELKLSLEERIQELKDSLKAQTELSHVRKSELDAQKEATSRTEAEKLKWQQRAEKLKRNSRTGIVPPS